jgi:hypothetical protein
MKNKHNSKIMAILCDPLVVEIIIPWSTISFAFVETHLNHSQEHETLYFIGIFSNLSHKNVNKFHA